MYASASMLIDTSSDYRALESARLDDRDFAVEKSALVGREQRVRQIKSSAHRDKSEITKSQLQKAEESASFRSGQMLCRLVRSDHAIRTREGAEK
jgi:hypothetical protein